MAKDAKPAEDGAEAPPKKSKKLLIIILAAVLVVVLAGGGAAFFLLKKSDHPEDEEAAAILRSLFTEWPYCLPEEGRRAGFSLLSSSSELLVTGAAATPWNG